MGVERGVVACGLLAFLYRLGIGVVHVTLRLFSLLIYSIRSGLLLDLYRYSPGSSPYSRLFIQ